MKIPHYISQIVPAPEGWTAHGDPIPGEEFWYESTDGVMVYPGEWHGWVRQDRVERQGWVRQSASGSRRVYPDPQSAFKATS